MDLISIIIPVYNCEKYLERCIESVINQTYKNLEIILINDGSTDKSSFICRKYKNIDSRIVFIDKNNEGLSKTRNKGIDICKGNWIYFLDSDDFIERNTIEILYSNAIKNNVDISIAYFKTLYSKNDIRFEVNEKDLHMDGIYNSIDFIKFTYGGGYINYISVVIWNKLFKKDVFKDIRFKYLIHEDYEISFRIYLNNYKIFLSTKPTYYYCRENDNSIIRTKSIESNVIYLDILHDRIKFLYKKKDKYMKYLYKYNLYLYCNLCIEYYYRILNVNKDFCYVKYKKIFKEIFIRFFFTLPLNIKTKIRFIFWYISPNLYKKLLVKFV